MEIRIPISVGELLDKISILQIKSQNTNSSFVKKELEDLIQIAKKYNVYDEDDLNQLLEVNQFLWDIEDELRFQEKQHNFDDDFIHNARMVYTTNDKRSFIKKQINEKYNSTYQEVKCYD